jgi:hypothetical protein
LRDAREQLASAGGQRPPDMHDGMSPWQEHTTVEKEP